MSENQDVFQNHALRALASQPEVQVLDKPYVPPTPWGVTPFRQPVRGKRW